MSYMESPRIQQMGHRSTSLGEALYIRVFTPSYRLLSWREIWDCFSESYPGQWAVQVFPPADELVDEANIYHLFVLDARPRGMDISQR